MARPGTEAIQDHGEAVRAVRSALDQLDPEPLSPLLEDRGLGPYRGLGELYRAVLELARRGPRLRVLGRSVRGIPIVALSIGPEPEPDSRTSVVLAGVHPNEWIGIETALELANRLAAEPLSRSVLLAPVLNPDGVLRVEQNLRAGRRRFVRHNEHGVDLNRNFDVAWGRRSYLAYPFRRLFRRGSYPASEPEVAAIGYALHPLRVDRALSLHSFGGAVLYPSAHAFRAPADGYEHKRWARRIGAAAATIPYPALRCCLVSFGRTGGLELDWFHERHGAISLLVECSRGGIRLSREGLTNPFAWFNPPDLRAVAQQIARACLAFVRGDPG
jgi:hypothetical protein